MLIQQARTLLREGNQNEIRVKEYQLKQITSIMLVGLFGFMSGFVSCKQLSDPLTGSIMEQYKRSPAFYKKSNNLLNASKHKSIAATK